MREQLTPCAFILWVLAACASASLRRLPPEPTPRAGSQASTQQHVFVRDTDGAFARLEVANGSLVVLFPHQYSVVDISDDEQVFLLRTSHEHLDPTFFVGNPAGHVAELKDLPRSAYAAALSRDGHQVAIGTGTRCVDLRCTSSSDIHIVDLKTMKRLTFPGRSGEFVKAIDWKEAGTLVALVGSQTNEAGEFFAISTADGRRSHGPESVRFAARKVGEEHIETPVMEHLFPRAYDYRGCAGMELRIKKGVVELVRADGRTTALFDDPNAIDNEKMFPRRIGALYFSPLCTHALIEDGYVFSVDLATGLVRRMPASGIENLSYRK